MKPKENNVTENKKNCRTWTCADKETLPSHVHWRFSPKRCKRRRWRGICTALSLTRSTEGDSWQARQLVFCAPTILPLHHAPPHFNHPVPREPPLLRAWQVLVIEQQLVLIILSHPTSVREHGSSNPGIQLTLTPHLLLTSPSFYR